MTASALPNLALAFVLLWAVEAGAVRRAEYGGALRIRLAGTMSTADPTRARTFGDWLLVGWVHRGLYRLDPADRALPDLLEGPCNRQAKGRRWRCTLRRDARFHDGRVARASDVRAAFRRAAVGPGAWLADVLRVEVLDDWTVRLVTARSLRSRELARLLASPRLVVPRPGAPRVGLGGFRIQSFHPEAGSVELVYAAGHHDGRPYLDAIVLSAGGGSKAAIEAFHYGNADVVFVDSDRYKAAVRKPGPRRSTIGLRVRSGSGPARQALFARSPRDGLAARIVGLTRAAEGLVPHRDAPVSARPPSSSASPPGRWFLGASAELESAATWLAGGLSRGQPWPVQGLDPASLRQFLANGGRYDAVLMSFEHVDPWAEAALRAIASWSGAPDPATLISSLPWIPLVDRARVLVSKRGLRDAYWTSDGLLRLADAFLVGSAP